MITDFKRAVMMTHRSQAHETQVFLGMEAVIASEPMRALLTTIERVARSQATVLITGESGTGKELIARAVHHYSLRSHKPWVDLSCAALPEHPSPLRKQPLILGHFVA